MGSARTDKRRLVRVSVAGNPTDHWIVMLEWSISQQNFGPDTKACKPARVEAEILKHLANRSDLEPQPPLTYGQLFQFRVNLHDALC